MIWIADDVLMHGKDQQDHDDNIRGFFKRYIERGIKPNRNKVEMNKTNITFMGHRVTSEDVETDPEKIAAIRMMAAPTNLAELRLFIGMVDYLAKFLPKLSCVMQTLHALLKKDAP